MMIGGLQKSTLIDYPGKISAIVFTAGCNLNCGYCHNPELRQYSPRSSEEEVLSFLRKRANQLDAVTITGGEPTVQPDLPAFAAKLKGLGFLVKLDTQGTNPQMVRDMVHRGLVDYIAMDLKAPLERYAEVTNSFVDQDAIRESISLIMAEAPDYEFRTTIVAEQLGVGDIEEIGKLIQGAKRHYAQGFVASKSLNDPAFLSRRAPGPEEMEEMRRIMSAYVREAFIR
ncbi:MAG: anaerobic ribonucleoside-triphosphate reductase activating protein [Patescibacteria group bacterium]